MTGVKNYSCPCCGYYMFEELRGYEICEICFWEDDPIQAEDPHYKGGANGISLLEAQANFQAFGACDIDLMDHVRRPTNEDQLRSLKTNNR